LHTLHNILYYILYMLYYLCLASVDHIETGDTKTPGQESADGKEDIHEHLTIAAEEMMATWSNEDERQSLPAAATSSAMTLG